MYAEIINAGYMQGKTNLTSHLYTYVRDRCKFSSDSDAPVICILGNPRAGTLQIYPYSFFRARVHQWIFLIALLCLGHMHMETIGLE